MMQMGIQYSDQGGSFQDDAYAGMLAAMDATLVALGTTKEPFQIQVVTRKIGQVFAYEKTGDKGVHRLGHRLPHGMVRPL